MTPFYNTPERVAALHAEAASWLGTPFLTNGHTKGEAVDCHNLCYALHRATGAWPVFTIPLGRSGVFGQVQVRKMSQFFEALPYVEAVAPDAPKLPGDILTGELRGVECHMIIYLGTINGQTESCISALKQGVGYVNLHDPNWSQKLVSIWRPIA